MSVLDSNPAFDLTHEKSMVVDEAQAFVMSLNWETRNVTETRDYAIVTRHPHEVAEIVECFDADWKRTAVHAASGFARSSGATATAASASRTSSTARSTRCGCRTSATRTR